MGFQNKQVDDYRPFIMLRNLKCHHLSLQLQLLE